TGLNSEHVYPYVGTDASSCRYNPQDRAANCSAVWLVAQGSEAALEQGPPGGPVSGAVDASSFYFHFYKSGVFSSMFCSQRVNHGMLAVGYGTSQERGGNVSYWILKNSWSEVWGEQGYIRLLKDTNNQCGVANQASFPML
ncbi:PREDICTED: cathepsin K-like, partial [Eurypyga helias]|uniref:cathepsin K-like n=1 Tax=Eurypyga helias TaxID=54383 RepID=UPI000528B596